jgi:hypothetical protein
MGEFVMAQQLAQNEAEEVIVAEVGTERDGSQQSSAPAGGEGTEEEPDSVVPWQGDPNKPPKPPKEGGKG